MKHPVAFVIIIAILLALLPYLPILNYNESHHTNSDEAKKDEELPLIDSDGDGMPDDWEITYGLDPEDARDANWDKDNDGWDFDRNGEISGGDVNETFTNLEEYLLGTDPTDKDSDKDGIYDGWEVHYSYDPLNSSDAEFDDDHDGFDENKDDVIDEEEKFTNLEEFQWDTSPKNPDTDNDNMTDGWEAHYDLDPTDPKDRDFDPDNDGFDRNKDGKVSFTENFTNLEEFFHGTNPRNKDSDDDGMIDGWEAYYFVRASSSENPQIYMNADSLDPTNPNGKHKDPDNDELDNYQEYKNPFDVDNYTHTDPIWNDSDDDGLLDGWEIFQKYYGSPVLDPTTNDTDGDGMEDGWEINWNLGWISDNSTRQYLNPSNSLDRDIDQEPDGWDIDRNQVIDESEAYTNLLEFYYGSNPFLTDSDQDRMPDGFEAAFGLNPINNDSYLDKDRDSMNEYLSTWGLPEVEDGEYSNIMEYNNGTNWTNPALNDTDGDGMWDGWEFYYSLNPLNKTDALDDMDNDGYDFNHDGRIDKNESFLNLEEFLNGTNPYLNDTDQDTMPDGWEVFYVLNPLKNDSFEDADDDGIVNIIEWNNSFYDVDGIIPMNPSHNDTDLDGIPDFEETVNGTDGYITDPTCNDTDMDGIPDGWEVEHKLDPTFLDDAEYDPDGDGAWLDINNDGSYDTYRNYSNLMEYRNKTDIYDPDTDGDGMIDGWEVFHGLNATNKMDSILDPDHDGIWNKDEFNSTVLWESDTDGEAYPDPSGNKTVYSDPTRRDTDFDGLSDFQELNFTNPTDPTNNDTDFDGMPDGWEVKFGLNPLDPSDAKNDTDNDSYDINGDGIISSAENYTNLDEYHNNTDPTRSDSDEDMIWDVWEAFYRQQCLDSKNITIRKLASDFNPWDIENDGADRDTDEDGLNNTLEFLNPITMGDDHHSTNPLVNDTDSDGILDGLECFGTIDFLIFTDPTTEDTDHDGMPDGWESNYTRGWIIPGELGDHTLDPTDPSDAGSDTDNDGYDYPWLPQRYRHFSNLQEYLFWEENPDYLCNPFDYDSLHEGYADGFIAYMIANPGGGL